MKYIYSTSPSPSLSRYIFREVMERYEEGVNNKKNETPIIKKNSVKKIENESDSTQEAIDLLKIWPYAGNLLPNNFLLPSFTKNSEDNLQFLFKLSEYQENRNKSNALIPQNDFHKEKADTLYTVLEKLPERSLKTEKEIKRKEATLDQNRCAQYVSTLFNYFRIQTKRGDAWTYDTENFDRIWKYEAQKNTWDINRLDIQDEADRLSDFQEMYKSLNIKTIHDGIESVIGYINLMSRNSPWKRNLIAWFNTNPEYKYKGAENTRPASHIAAILTPTKFPIGNFISIKDYFQTKFSLSEKELLFLENHFGEEWGKDLSHIEISEREYPDYLVAHQNGKGAEVGSMLEKIILLGKTPGERSYFPVAYYSIKKNSEPTIAN